MCNAIKKINSKRGMNLTSSGFMLGFVLSEESILKFTVAVLVRKNIFRKVTDTKFQCGCWKVKCKMPELFVSSKPNNNSKPRKINLCVPPIVTGYQLGNWIHHDQGWSKLNQGDQFFLEPLNVEWFISPNIRNELNETKVKIVFEPGRIGFSFCRTKVLDVIPDSQANRKGVHVGWHVIAINGVSLPKDDVGIDGLEFLRNRSENAEFTFSVPKSDLALEQKTSDVNKPSTTTHSVPDPSQNED